MNLSLNWNYFDCFGLHSYEFETNLFLFLFILIFFSCSPVNLGLIWYYEYYALFCILEIYSFMEEIYSFTHTQINIVLFFKEYSYISRYFYYLVIALYAETYYNSLLYVLSMYSVWPWIFLYTWILRFFLYINQCLCLKGHV